MRRTLAICTLLAASSLGACKLESGITTNNYVSINGKAVSATRSRIVDGVGEFECVRSPSGRCHYLLFVGGCPAKATDAPPRPEATASTRTAATAGSSESGCAARTLQAFTLDEGSSKLIGNLPRDVHQCVDNQSPPIAPRCLRDNRG